MPKFNLLILGGTSEGVSLAKSLNKPNVSLIYSVAGLVRTPKLGCPVIEGGFGHYGGLTNFLKGKSIHGILDATHPYAVNMSEAAQKSAKEVSIHYWRYERPAWSKQQGDIWFEFDDAGELIDALSGKKNVFLTAGQLTENLLNRFNEYAGQRQLFRTAVEPKAELPNSMSWLKGIGPFDVKSELTLFKKYQIDALVSKNSGGTATDAKLKVARKLGVPVYMLNRPYKKHCQNEFKSTEECSAFVINYIKGRSHNIQRA